MKAFDTDTSIRWLFCMTHPDDEISICAWIKRLRDAGAEVYINWTHSTEIRRSEGRVVGAKLGIPDSNLSFMDAPDGSVCDHLVEYLPQFQELMQRVEPDRVVCGAFEQGHLDHDSTNWLVNHSFEGPVFEAPFYHPYSRRLQRMNVFAVPDGQECLPLAPKEWRLKLEIAKAYPSQNIWTVLWWHEVWQSVRLRPAELRKRELMRLQVHRDFKTPNLPEPLRSEVIQCVQWKRWLGAVERANMSP